jgi:hypothetical protein
MRKHKPKFKSKPNIELMQADDLINKHIYFIDGCICITDNSIEFKKLLEHKNNNDRR